ncbi:MAG: DNA replication/repair protein RecF [Chlamydiota bacterium]
MKLRFLRLFNFRGYEDTSFEFSPGVNHIVGPNAAGKTSVLEAIHLLMCGRSFRTGQNSELIRYETPSFYIEGQFEKHGVEQVVKLAYDGSHKKILINNTQCQSYNHLLGVVLGVVFTPDDAALVKGVPGGRRQFLDLHISQFDPLYVHHSSRYQRAMKQRNSMLRKGKLDGVFPWEEEMAKAAEYLTRKRKQVVQELEESSREIYRKLSSKSSQLTVFFKSTLGRDDPLTVKERFLAMMERNRLREKEAGITFVGPHKDDVLFGINGKELKIFGSEGQQRSCVAALRLATWERLHEHSKIKPLMLVDDVGMSLDTKRQSKLSEHLSNLGQVFLTSTELTKPASNAHVIYTQTS